MESSFIGQIKITVSTNCRGFFCQACHPDMVNGLYCAAIETRPITREKCDVSGRRYQQRNSRWDQV